MSSYQTRFLELSRQLTELFARAHQAIKNKSKMMGLNGKERNVLVDVFENTLKQHYPDLYQAAGDDFFKNIIFDWKKYTSKENVDHNYGALLMLATEEAPAEERKELQRAHNKFLSTYMLFVNAKCKVMSLTRHPKLYDIFEKPIQNPAGHFKFDLDSLNTASLQDFWYIIKISEEIDFFSAKWRVNFCEENGNQIDRNFISDYAENTLTKQRKILISDKNRQKLTDKIHNKQTQLELVLNILTKKLQPEYSYVLTPDSPLYQKAQHIRKKFVRVFQSHIDPQDKNFKPDLISLEYLHQIFEIYNNFHAPWEFVAYHTHIGSKDDKKTLSPALQEKLSTRAYYLQKVYQANQTITDSFKLHNLLFNSQPEALHYTPLNSITRGMMTGDQEVPPHIIYDDEPPLESTEENHDTNPQVRRRPAPGNAKAYMHRGQAKTYDLWQKVFKAEKKAQHLMRLMNSQLHDILWNTTRLSYHVMFAYLESLKKNAEFFVADDQQYGGLLSLKTINAKLPLIHDADYEDGDFWGKVQDTLSVSPKMSNLPEELMPDTHVGSLVDFVTSAENGKVTTKSQIVDHKIIALGTEDMKQTLIYFDQVLSWWEKVGNDIVTINQDGNTIPKEETFDLHAYFEELQNKPNNNITINNLGTLEAKLLDAKNLLSTVNTAKFSPGEPELFSEMIHEIAVTEQNAVSRNYLQERLMALSGENIQIEKLAKKTFPNLIETKTKNSLSHFEDNSFELNSFRQTPLLRLTLNYSEQELLTFKQGLITLYETHNYTVNKYISMAEGTFDIIDAKHQKDKNTTSTDQSSAQDSGDSSPQNALEDFGDTVNTQNPYRKYELDPLKRMQEANKRKWQEHLDKVNTELAEQLAKKGQVGVNKQMFVYKPAGSQELTDILRQQQFQVYAQAMGNVVTMAPPQQMTTYGTVYITQGSSALKGGSTSGGDASYKKPILRVVRTPIIEQPQAPVVRGPGSVHPVLSTGGRVAGAYIGVFMMVPQIYRDGKVILSPRTTKSQKGAAVFDLTKMGVGVWAFGKFVMKKHPQVGAGIMMGTAAYHGAASIEHYLLRPYLEKAEFGQTGQRLIFTNEEDYFNSRPLGPSCTDGRKPVFLNKKAGHIPLGNHFQK